MKVEIKPYIGVDHIEFGMSIDTIRKNIGGKFRSRRKAPFSIVENDQFLDKGAIVTYKPPGVCNAFELFSPYDPIFEGHRLIGEPFNQVVSWLGKRDPKLRIDDVGLLSFEFGFGVYAPYHETDPNALIEGVIVFERGSYDGIY